MVITLMEILQVTYNLLRKKFKSSIKIGMTLNEFLVLPERARISIIYEGDFGAEGFLCLKRM